MIKDIIDEKSTVSSTRIIMFMGVFFSFILTGMVVLMNKDPNAWLPLISMFFLGAITGKVVQKFGEKDVGQ